MYVAAVSKNSGNEVHLSRKAQIAYLKVDEAPSKVPNKYADFVDVFSPKLAVELREHTEINNYTIDLEDN